MYYIIYYLLIYIRHQMYHKFTWLTCHYRPIQKNIIGRDIMNKFYGIFNNLIFYHDIMLLRNIHIFSNYCFVDKKFLMNIGEFK